MLAFLVCSLLMATDPPVHPPTDAVWRVLTDEKRDDLSAALANHPDVHIAEAELRIAQAELTKIKHAVAQQVTAAKAKAEQARAVLTRAEATAAEFKPLTKMNPDTQRRADQAALLVADAKAARAAVEAELKAVTGAIFPATQSLPITLDLPYNEVLNLTAPRTCHVPPSPHNPVAEKLTRALDKVITLDVKGPF